MDIAKSVHETPLQLLIVDDEPDLLEILSDVFRDSGAHVFSATNGIEALETFRAEQIDVILSDIAMPMMNGLVLCNTLFELTKTLDQVPKVFLMTGSDIVSLPENLRTHLRLEVVTKPFDILALTNRVMDIKGTKFME